MVCIGIDPALRFTGYCAIKYRSPREVELLGSGVVTTKSHASLAERIAEIARDIEHLAVRFQPACAGVEETYVNANMQTSLALAHGRAAAIAGLVRQQPLAVYTFSPSTVKKNIAGRGDATKKAVAQAVVRLIPALTIARYRDTTDAGAIAICAALAHAASVKFKSKPRFALNTSLKGV